MKIYGKLIPLDSIIRERKRTFSSRRLLIPRAREKREAMHYSVVRSERRETPYTVGIYLSRGGRATLSD